MVVLLCMLAVNSTQIFIKSLTILGSQNAMVQIKFLWNWWSKSGDDYKSFYVLGQKYWRLILKLFRAGLPLLSGVMRRRKRLPEEETPDRVWSHEKSFGRKRTKICFRGKFVQFDWIKLVFFLRSEEYSYSLPVEYSYICRLRCNRLQFVDKLQK